MAYIGSAPLSQYWREGTDTFTVGAIPQAVFYLPRIIPSINSIALSLGGDGTNFIAPDSANYSLSAVFEDQTSILTLANPIANTTLFVRYFTAPTYAFTPDVNSIGLGRLVTNNSYLQNPNYHLRGDGTWIGIGIPLNIQSSAYTLAPSDVGKCVVIRSALPTTTTIPANVFQVGDTFSIFNSPDVSAFSQSIVRGVGAFSNLEIDNSTLSNTADIPPATYGTLVLTATSDANAIVAAAYFTANTTNNSYQLTGTNLVFSVAMAVASANQVNIFINPNTTVTSTIPMGTVLQVASNVRFIIQGSGYDLDPIVQQDAFINTFLCVAPNDFVVS